MTPEDSPISIASALAMARQAGVERLDAQTLLGHMLGQSRAWLISHDTDLLDAGQAQRYRQLLARAAADEPLAYLLGEQSFHGLDLVVSPAVLVPRPDTEVLVEWGLSLLKASSAALPAPAVIDLGTGSGAVALAVARGAPGAQVSALDASADALAVAQANAERLGLGVRFILSDWWRALGDMRFDLALSNPPYIAGEDPHLPALRHEPLMALTPGGDGLDAIRQIIAGAPAHLHPGAWLLIEHGWDQGDAVRALFKAAGYTEVCTRLDLAQRERCTGGRSPETRPASLQKLSPQPPAAE